jgi:polysaccharide deacetylase 2 family uncharacterized protein YibQ
MARGFLAGTFWGFVVGAVIFLTATLLADRQEPLLPQPSAGGATIPAPDASEFDAVEAQEEPALPEPETAPGGSAEIAEAPAVPAPAAEPAPAPAAATVAEPAATATAPDAPAPPAEAPAPEVATAPQAVEAPRSGDAPAPAQPASDAPLVAGTAAPERAPEPEAPEEEIAALPPSVSDSAPDAPPVAEAPRTETPLPQLTDTMPGAEPEAETATEPEAEALPEAGEAPAVPGTIAAAMPGQRAAPLPGIAAEETLPEPAPEAEAELAPAPEGMGALQAYSVPFEAPADRPILALVLLVPPGTDAAMLAAFPVPASFAIDALAPEAADTARTLRAAGRELLLIPALPEGATPADVEVALQANVAAVPEAVAFIDGPDASFQSDRTAVAQVVAAAGASGHGLVTFPRGLNTAQQIARRDGVPAALVFRDFDAEGQSSDEIRRILDQAAFRARQEGAVILVGRASPGTLAALTEWALGSRAASVALAPVSAALLAQD